MDNDADAGSGIPDPQPLPPTSFPNHVQRGYGGKNTVAIKRNKTKWPGNYYEARKDGSKSLHRYVEGAHR
jgi:hypothetical protein